MTKLKDVIEQCVKIIPTLTDLFNTSYTVSSLTRSGTTVTVVTSAPHGYVTGNKVRVIGAQAPVEIINLFTNDGGIAFGEVDHATPHDLTEGYQATIKITGATENEYNGTELPLLTVPNRYTFSYSISGTPDSPATGDPILLFDGKDRGYNGTFIITVIDTVTFTYQIDAEPYEIAYGNITVSKGVRISGGVNIERLEQTYTNKRINELWGYWVADPLVISKDRNSLSDATSEHRSGDDFLIQQIQSFSFYVFVPTAEDSDLAARVAKDLMVDIRGYLYKTLLRFKLPSYLAAEQTYGVGPLGDQTAKYTGAYYIHEFNYEILSDINFHDTFTVSDNVAFRDVDGTIESIDNGDPLLFEANLDDEPVNN